MATEDMDRYQAPGEEASVSMPRAQTTRPRWFLGPDKLLLLLQPMEITGYPGTHLLVCAALSQDPAWVDGILLRFQ